VGAIVAPQDVLVLIPERLKLTQRGRRDLADEMKLETWRWEDCPGLSGGSSVVTRVLRREAGESR